MYVFTGSGLKDRKEIIRCIFIMSDKPRCYNGTQQYKSGSKANPNCNVPPIECIFSVIFRLKFLEIPMVISPVI